MMTFDPDTVSKDEIKDEDKSKLQDFITNIKQDNSFKVEDISDDIKYGLSKYTLKEIIDRYLKIEIPLNANPIDCINLQVNIGNKISEVESELLRSKMNLDHYKEKYEYIKNKIIEKLNIAKKNKELEISQSQIEIYSKIQANELTPKRSDWEREYSIWETCMKNLTKISKIVEDIGNNNKRISYMSGNKIPNKSPNETTTTSSSSKFKELSPDED